jgi:hypothetical protein
MPTPTLAIADLDWSSGHFAVAFSSLSIARRRNSATFSPRPTALNFARRTSSSGNFAPNAFRLFLLTVSLRKPSYNTRKVEVKKNRIAK